MTVSLNGLRVLTADIHEPRNGVWFADVVADSEEVPTGAVTLDVGGVQFVGTVRRGAVEFGKVTLRVVGGADSLKDEIDAKFYRDATVAILLADICRETGETLSGATTPGKLSVTFPKHMRSLGTGAQAVAQVAADAKAEWRILRDGMLWLGEESWPAVDVPGVTIGTHPAESALTYAPDDGALVAPGTLHDGQKVGKVTTLVRPEGVRQTVYFDDATGVGDRLMAAMKRIVNSVVGKRLDYSALYPATVVAQAANGKVEIKCDDAKIAGRGLTAIPIRHGLPGMEVAVKRGARVLLGFEAQDPRRPYVALWDSADVTTLTLNGDIIEIGTGGKPVARAGDPITVFLPPVMPVTGVILPANTPFAGTITVLTPASGMIAGGNPQVQA